ncbi:MAG TPA: DUF1501 domain-containing protein [Kofleriaceae bacterium]|nr:DUF1501 domain-containing protein [Kofleriaceae bacterium]
MLKRRDILRLALGTSAWLAGTSLGCSSKKKPPPPRDEPTGPRYWVMVLLSGGHDTLFTTDPKTAAEVDGMVTLPIDNKIVTADGVKLGPHFAPLARWAPELAVLNGVQVRTVNHDTGQKQFCHLKSNIADVMPSVLDAIATRRPGQPLGVAYLNLSSRIMHTPAYFGSADPFYFGKGDVFDQVANAKPEELVALAKVLRRRAGDVSRSVPGWREAEQTARYYYEVADFFEVASKVEPMEGTERSTDYVAQTMGNSLDRALWLIENDLCSGIVMDLGLLGWDTHIRNESKQAEMNGHFAKLFDEFMSELRARRNRFGVLADNTVTVVGSELGRFPHQNDMLGKDHLPQTSFLFSGPGLKKGRAFGRTGRRMEGLPIAYTNGDHVDAGRVPVIDDIGTTLLHLAGLDPERFGYTGRVCQFLLDRTS